MKLEHIPQGLSPLEIVQAQYPLPLTPRKYQADGINDLAPRPRCGLWAEVGTGKTLMATAIAIYRMLLGSADCWIVNVPPILIRQWYRFLTKIPGLRVVMYRGAPKQRDGLDIEGAHFIIMSMQVFKKDIGKLDQRLTGKRCGSLVDEATSIKNIESQNYQSVRDFHAADDMILLSGTPLTTPLDAYAYIKLISPTIYKHQQEFLNLHAGERDFYDKIVSWERLDLLASNFKVNAVRLFKRDVLKDLPPVTYDPIHYDLEPAHEKLYQAIANEQLTKLAAEGKDDSGSESSLYQKLQQVVMCPEHFAEKPIRATGYDLLDEVLDEVGAADSKKLIVVTWYKRSSAAVFNYLTSQSPGWRGTKDSAALLVGGLSDSQRERALDRFMTDDKCRALVLQPGAGGKGTDGLQDVCSDMMFLELPLTALDFQQTVGRLDRPGQTKPVHVRAAIAEGTVQHQMWLNSLEKEALANKVQRSWEDLKQAVYGRTKIQGDHHR